MAFARTVMAPRPDAEHAAVRLAARLELIGVRLGELAVGDGLVELRVLRGGERRAELLRSDVEPLGRVVEDRRLGVVGRRRDGAARERRSCGDGTDGCDASKVHGADDRGPG